ncbi:MAG: hypothetical protein JWN99_1774 [Ilumatobacteraceae bacterium]|nr:hypothetical protein [Ilumatobacteraceae bacterium]
MCATLLVIGSLVALSACGKDDARALVGYPPTGVQQVDATALPDAANGDAPFTFRAQPDHLLIAYFGHTSCPDVCPTTLTAVKSALTDLGDDAARVDVAMATIDPTRDTDQVLTGYVQSFVHDAHALRTTDDTTLRQASEAFGVTYNVVAAADGQIDVTHTGALYVVDDQGMVALTWPFGVTASDIAGDLKTLLHKADA